MAEARFKTCILCGKIFRPWGRQLACSQPCSKQRISAKAATKSRRWRSNNRKESRLHGVIGTARYRAGPAMPAWVDKDEIRRIYAECPPDLVVDHIIPLARRKLGFSYVEGRPICGLHVPWNLQYITQGDNVLKGERLASR